MKVLVTGGAGFIGFHTCKELLARGHEVIIIDDLSTGTIRNINELSHDDLTFFEGSILDYEFVADVFSRFDKIDAVIHLAAKVSVRESIEKPAATSLVNVQGFVTVLNIARLFDVPRFVYASSAAIYGESSNCIDIGTQAYSPISPYGLDKLTNEHYGDLFFRLYGIQTVGLRYFNVYGPRQDPRSSYAGVIGKFIDKALNSESMTIFGDGEQSRNFIYVGDIAKVNATAAIGDESFKSFQGVVNVGSPHGGTTLNELTEKVHKATGKSTTTLYDDPVEGDIKISKPHLNKLRTIYPAYMTMLPLDEGLAHLVKYLKSIP